MALRKMLQRFAGPVVAAYLLHLGVWSLIMAGTQVAMSALTRILNSLADHSLAGFPRVEEEAWLPHFLAPQIAEGFVPIIVGLLIGWWILHREQNAIPPL
jgi:hypothetical protein